MRDVVSLDKLKEGERGKVINLIGGRAFKLRLIQLGIMPGVEVKVYKECSPKLPHDG